MPSEFQTYLQENRILQASNKDLFPEDLPELGFGSWLKDNADGLLKGAGSIAGFLPPPISTIAGPILNIAGSVVGGVKAKNQAQADADAEQALIDEQTALDAKATQDADLANRRSAFGQANQQYNFGSSFAEFGGQIGQSLMGQPQITEYSKDAYLHGEGPDGIPVDSMGNPSKVSNMSAVALTEAGEVAWNGYIFSDKLKTK